MKKISVVLVGHGSKIRGFEAPLKKVVRDLSRSGRFLEVMPAYLEIAPPSIPEAIDACVRRGAKRVKILPYFLLLGTHVTVDLPKIASAAKKKYRGWAKVELCPYLGYDARITELIRKRLSS